MPSRSCSARRNNVRPLGIKIYPEAGGQPAFYSCTVSARPPFSSSFAWVRGGTQQKFSTMSKYQKIFTMLFSMLVIPLGAAYAADGTGSSSGNHHNGEGVPIHAVIHKAVRVDKTNIRKEVLKTEESYALMAFLDYPLNSADSNVVVPPPPLVEVLDKLGQEYSGKVKVVYLNVNKSPNITRHFRDQLGIEDKSFVCLMHRIKGGQEGSAIRKEWTEENLREFIEDGLKDQLHFVKSKPMPAPIRFLMNMELPKIPGVNTMEKFLTPPAKPNASAQKK